MIQSGTARRLASIIALLALAGGDGAFFGKGDEVVVFALPEKR